MFSQPLILGSTYRLKFKSAFERHGVCTTPGVTCLHPGGGVFRLEQITNFRDVVLAGIKLYDVFFKPLGFSEEEYSKYFDGKPADEFVPEYTTKKVSNEVSDTETTTVDGKLVVVEKKVVTSHEVHVETGKSRIKKHYKDDVNYASYPVYKFVDAVDTSDVIYVPELTLAEFPEIDISEYKDLSLVIHLGYLDDPARIDPMLLSIRERMAAYGWRPNLVRLYCTDTKWLSASEYEAIKNMRVPAKLVMIDENTRADYLGETAIVSGQFKKIAERVTAATASTEIDIDTIMKHPAIIDNKLFIVQCTDSDTFIAGDTYYLQTFKMVDGVKVSCLKILKEGYDFSPGDACVAYAPLTSTELADNKYASVQKYIKNPATYTMVEYGKHNEYTASSLLRKLTGTVYRETTDTYRNTSKQYYLYVGEQEYVPTTDSDFTFRYASMTLGTSYNESALALLPEIYVNDSGSYVKVDWTADTSPFFTAFGSGSDRVIEPNHDYSFFTKEEGTGFIPSNTYLEKVADNQEVYRQATEEEVNDPSQVLYFKNPDTYTATTDTSDTSKVYYVRTIDLSETEKSDLCVALYKEVYATKEALELQGFKFSYQDMFKYTQNLTLQLEDIIDVGLSETVVTLPNSEFEYNKYWKEYEGRRFRWQESSSSDPTQTVTLEVTISDKTYKLVSQKSGVLLGQSGQIGMEVYVKDSDSLKRNYYMKYVTQLKTVEDQKARIEALENLVLELAGGSANENKE